jgi:ketosteroid isomerase-like protein
MRETAALEVALSFVEKINAHDVDGIAALMTPDHIFIDGLGSTFRRADSMRAGWKAYLEGFPDYAVEVTQQFSRGDEVALFRKARGTYRVNGRLPRENSWEIPAAWRLIRNGRIAEWQVYCDNDPARKIVAATNPENEGLAASHKLDDLEPVAGLDLCFGPKCARQNVQIPFDCYAVCFHPQMFEQRSDGEPVGNFLPLTIHHNRHGETFGAERMTSRISSLPAGALA